MTQEEVPQLTSKEKKNTNIEELNKNYQKLRGEWPTFGAVLSRAYKKKQASLKKL